MMVKECCCGEGNRSLGRPEFGWENSNGMNHKILWCESVTVYIYIQGPPANWAIFKC